MTDLLEKAMGSAGRLPPEKQDEIARVVLALTSDDHSVHRCTPDEAAEQEAADAEEARSEYATDEEVRAIMGIEASAHNLFADTP